jgi:hypothetical protein
VRLPSLMGLPVGCISPAKVGPGESPWATSIDQHEPLPLTAAYPSFCGMMLDFKAAWQSDGVGREESLSRRRARICKADAQRWPSLP